MYIRDKLLAMIEMIFLIAVSIAFFLPEIGPCAPPSALLYHVSIIVVYASFYKLKKFLPRRHFLIHGVICYPAVINRATVMSE